VQTDAFNLDIGLSILPYQKVPWGTALPSGRPAIASVKAEYEKESKNEKCSLVLHDNYSTIIILIYNTIKHLLVTNLMYS